MSAVAAFAHRDRAAVYRGLARLFGRPGPAWLEALRGCELPELRRALRRLDGGSALDRTAREIGERLRTADADSLRQAWHATFAARPDHVTAELEFMHRLAVEEALVQEDDGDPERSALCRDAACRFLADHLGRWTEPFAKQVGERAADPLYAAAGRLVAGFVAHEAAWLGVETDS